MFTTAKAECLRGSKVRLGNAGPDRGSALTGIWPASKASLRGPSPGSAPTPARPSWNLGPMCKVDAAPCPDLPTPPSPHHGLLHSTSPTHPCGHPLAGGSSRNLSRAKPQTQAGPRSVSPAHSLGAPPSSGSRPASQDQWGRRHCLSVAASLLPWLMIRALPHGCWEEVAAMRGPSTSVPLSPSLPHARPTSTSRGACLLTPAMLQTHCPVLCIPALLEHSSTTLPPAS